MKCTSINSVVKRAVSLVCALVFLFAFTVQASAKTMYVKTPGNVPLRIRAAASSQSKVVGKAAYGKPVNVIGKKGFWFKVKVGKVTGYMYKSYLSVNKPTDPAVPGSVSRQAVIKTPKGMPLNLRAKADASSKLLGRYANGTAVTVYRKAGSWYRVSVNGRVGYMYAQYVVFK